MTRIDESNINEVWRQEITIPNGNLRIDVCKENDSLYWVNMTHFIDGYVSNKGIQGVNFLIGRLFSESLGDAKKKAKKALLIKLKDIGKAVFHNVNSVDMLVYLLNAMAKQKT